MIVPFHKPRGSIVVPFWGSYLIESYKVIPKRNYWGAYGQTPRHFRECGQEALGATAAREGAQGGTSTSRAVWVGF